MNTDRIIQFIKKIDLYLWVILGVGLALFIFLLVKSLAQGNMMMVYYVLIIFLINLALALYSSLKSYILPYILGISTIAIELFAILAAFSKIN